MARRGKSAVDSLGNLNACLYASSKTLTTSQVHTVAAPDEQGEAERE